MPEITAEIRNKLIASGAVLVALILVRWLVLRVVHRYLDEAETWYRARKIATYTTTVVVLITLSWIWLEAFDNLTTYLGLVSAGIAIALSDLLKNMAGWLYILTRRPFRVGDRIEVAGSKGDVIDVRLFRFSLMEIGNWVHADQSTGRMIHVPNGVVFTSSVANYTEGFAFIWHEIPVLVTFESNWEKGERILLELLRANTVDVQSHVGRRLRETARQYQIKIGTLTPIVYVTVQDSGVLLTGRFLVAARERRGAEQRVWRALLTAFAAEPDVDLAYPTVRTYLHGPIALTTSQETPVPAIPGDADPVADADA